MPKQNRNTLKSFFSDGAMPSSDMFEDFIDSGININDDGFEKTSIDGLKISTTGSHNALISLYDQKNRSAREWGIELEGDQNSLHIGYAYPDKERNQQANKNTTSKLQPAIVLDKSNNQMRMAVGHQLPKDALDVQGNLRSQGRRGSFGYSFHSVKADGKWYSITEPLNDGVALEVMARAINREKKYYGMMHAIAMHSPWRAKRDLMYFLGRKNRIRYTHGFYDSALHRLKLRWRRIKGEQGYRLQIRTNCNFGDAGILDFHITSLWTEDSQFIPIVSDEVEVKHE